MSDLTIEELEALLEEKKREHVETERARLRKLQDATPVVWQYTILPNTKFYRTDEVMDPAVRVYRLEGKVTNREEALAVGHQVPMEGGMDFLFNTLSGRLIMHYGGGTIFVGGFTKEEKEEALLTFEKINVFLRNNPEGGDITDIVEEYRRQRWANVSRRYAKPQTEENAEVRTAIL